MFGKVIERVLFGAVIAYIAFNVWTFYEVFSPAECTDIKSCVFPGWSTSDKIAAQVSFSETGGPVFHSFEVPEFDLQTGIKWVTNVKVSKITFKDADVICNIRVLTPSKVVILNKDVRVITRRQPNPHAYNLLSSQKNDAHQNLHESAIHWLSELQVFLLRSPVSFPLNGIPREILPHFRVTYDRSSFVYPPLFHINPQLQPASDWIELQDIPSGELNFTVQFMPLSIGKFRLRCMLEQTAEYLKNMGIKDKDVEDIQGIFTDTNLYLLLATVVVSVFHLFFDFLAFKNDIQFWKNTKNTAGISIRTIIWRCLSTTIIFLYLYDEKSSLLIVVPAGISMVIEFWKLCRMAKISFSLRGGVSVGNRSEKELETDELDARFMRRLMYLIVPLCFAGAIYSLMYMPHRSWRSWVLQTAVNGVYAFGFLLMTPQLFINYQLKSVANLPWRALTYKAFNTFIDDFFAFIIKMPTAHRVACFRDDIIFVVYMYQRWLYPVDHTRVNEFGQQESTEEPREGPSSNTSKLKTA